MDLKPLVTLLAIVNPLAIVPFFIHYTQGFSEAQRKRTIRTAALSAFLVIAACALLGLQILEFFNISLPSFQVGGGMLLLISAMNMLNAQTAEAKAATNELEEGAEKVADGSEKAYKATKKGVKKGAKKVENGAEKAYDATKKEAKEVKEKVDGDNRR